MFLSAVTALSGCKPQERASSTHGEGTYTLPSDIFQDGASVIPRPNLGSSMFKPNIETQYGKVASTNFGDRLKTDAQGRRLNNKPMLVFHETVLSEAETLAKFAKAGEDVSYHALVARDGRLVLLVPFSKRAFGAGNSAFGGRTLHNPGGSAPREQVVTSPKYPGSVNNFSVHISLVSPTGSESTAGGRYTDAQYRTLAWFAAQTGIPKERFTTHALVDLDGDRSDPEDFQLGRFDTYYQTFTTLPKDETIAREMAQMQQ